MADKRVLVAASGAKRPLRLGRQLNRGGAAGSIHEDLGGTGSVVKIYHRPEIARIHQNKIWAMLRRAPNLPAISRDGRTYTQVSWPTEAG
jgi:DNA-binding helix-hairpin-helix protein with protein kinase domain